MNYTNRNRRADNEWNDSQAASVHDLDNSHNLSPSRYRTMLSRRDAEIQKEKQRYRDLEVFLQKAQDDIQQLKSKNTRLRTDIRNGGDKSFAMIETHMHSYARQRGFRFEPMSNRSVPQLLDQLLDSWTENDDLRKEVKLLRANTQAMQGKLQAAEQVYVDRQLVDDKVRNLQEQVHTLQQQLLTRVDRECAVSDDRFTKEFRCLIASVKSLSRSIYIPKDKDVIEILGVGGMLIDVDKDQWSTRARKKCLVEAWVWSILIDRVFDSPFALLEDDGDSMADVWYRLFGADHQHGWPAPSTLCEKWRCTTMEHSIKAFGLDAFMSDYVQDTQMVNDDGLDSLFRNNEAACFKIRANTINIISSRLATLSSKGDFAQIPTIVDRAIRMALEMSLQRCRLQLTYPAIGSPFVEGEMSSLVDFDGDELQDSVVAFIVNPGLTKWDDATGKDLNQRYDIVHSLVQLQTPETCEESTYIDGELV
jgi:predicted  nucleic acid-binding Zn-ribbon protein